MIYRQKSKNISRSDSLSYTEARQYIVSSFLKSYGRKSNVSISDFIADDLIKIKNWGQFKYDEGKIWTAAHNSTVHRHLHSWLFLNEWIAQIPENDIAIDIIVSITQNWSESFLKIADDDPFFRIAYHDEATAQRMRIAIKLHHNLLNHGKDAKESTGLVKTILDHTASKLESQAFYSGLNNHGMFQSLALRDYAVYAEWLNSERRSKLLGLANSRLDEYFDKSFTSEGVHVEHSPSYHLMVLRHVAEHRDFLESLTGSRSEFLDHLLNNAEQHSVHTILPDGRFLPVSDTQQIALSSSKNNIFNSKVFQFASTAGREGVKPSDLTLYEPKSGYFIHRNTWDSTTGNYIAFIAAYNAHYHKHSDDLHVFLWSGGNEILSESGPYGYDGTNPFVKLGFSQWSHNNIVVDGRSLKRTDGMFDKVSMINRFRISDGWQVEAKNERFDSVVHSRKVTFSDSLDAVFVEDLLVSDSKHNYFLNWNFGPKVRLQIVDKVIHGFIDNLKVVEMVFDYASTFEILHRRGVVGTNARGWRFPSMNEKTPASLVSVKFSGSTSKICTSIRIFNNSEDVLFPAEFLSKKHLALIDEDPNLRILRDVNMRELICAFIMKNLQNISDENSVGLDSSIRAVIKLYDKRRLIETLSGRVSTMVWPALTPGTYRVRVYLKGPAKSSVPFTTPWFKV